MYNPKKCIENAKNRVLINKLKGVVCDFISKIDNLVGLKENVILGHLIPAGTGFQLHQQSEVKIKPEALAEIYAERDRIMAQRANLLNEPDLSNSSTDGK